MEGVLPAFNAVKILILHSKSTLLQVKSLLEKYKYLKFGPQYRSWVTFQLFVCLTCEFVFSVDDFMWSGDSAVHHP